MEYGYSQEWEVDRQLWMNKNRTRTGETNREGEERRSQEKILGLKANIKGCLRNCQEN